MTTTSWYIGALLAVVFSLMAQTSAYAEGCWLDDGCQSVVGESTPHSNPCSDSRARCFNYLLTCPAPPFNYLIEICVIAENYTVCDPTCSWTQSGPTNVGCGNFAQAPYTIQGSGTKLAAQCNPHYLCATQANFDFINALVDDFNNGDHTFVEMQDFLCDCNLDRCHGRAPSRQWMLARTARSLIFPFA